MSYIRYGEHGSQVYVYDQGDGEMAEPCCSGCGFVAYCYGQIARHLAEHQARGEHVPDELMVALANDDRLAYCDELP